MPDSSRHEAAFVLLLMQALFWMMAGISAIPFAIAGEVFMPALGLASLLLALGTCLVGLGVLWRRRWARRVVLVLEVLCLVGSVLLMALPLGANHGLVAWMVNVGLPIALLLILAKSTVENPALT
jgi:hypothetical protein